MLGIRYDHGACLSGRSRDFRAHPNRHAWTPAGKYHMIDARRGRRLNLPGAQLSSGITVRGGATGNDTGNAAC